MKYFSRVEVSRNSDRIFLSQHKYALGIISEVRLLGSKLVGVPLGQNHRQASVEGRVFDDSEHYRSLVGRLIYLCFTLLEFSCCIYVLSRFMQQPKEEHISKQHCGLYFTGRGIQDKSFCKVVNVICVSMDGATLIEQVVL